MKSQRTGVELRGRRAFLRGVGGATLALPFLPSLLPRVAADAGPDTGPRFFIAMQNQQGAVFETRRVPQTTIFDEQRTYAERTIHRGRLNADLRDGRAFLSDVLQADAGTLTPSLLDKLNYLQGFDIPTYIGHNAAAFGNLGNNHQGGGKLDETPSIDQLMAWSPSFYRDLSTIKERSINWGHLAYGFSNPASRSGAVQKVRFSGNAFNAIYVEPDDVTREGPARPLLVDRVLENYRRLRDSDQRLSAGDRRRLDAHMERLFELQRRSAVVASCGDVSEPARTDSFQRGRSNLDGSFQAERHQKIHMETIVAGILCGTCRLWTIGLDNCAPGQMAGRDFHHRAHNNDIPEHQQDLVDANQTIFEEVFLHLAKELDAIEYGDGATYLDRSLIFWTNENSHNAHHNIDMPVVTAGSACGHFETGYHVDYRIRELDTGSWSRAPRAKLGLFYHQLLANMLDAMGVPKAEYDLYGHGGYGDLLIDDTQRGDADYRRDYAAAERVMGQALPFWVRGA